MNKKIMIVDDEPDVLLSLKTLLEKHNYDVITRSNGKDCIKELHKGFRGIILMDLMMPEMDGWDTINEIVKNGYINEVAISVITGKGTKDFQKMSMLGSYIYDYLAKPIDLEILIKSIDRGIKYLYSKNY